MTDPRSLLTSVRHRPLAWYFGLAALLSFVAFAVIGPPKLDGSGGRPPLALAMFPVMVIGIGGVGVALTAILDGSPGLRAMRQRWHLVGRRWLLLLIVPPACVLIVLGTLTASVSSSYHPQFLVYGVAAGAIPGFFEELGWTGFAYPRLSARFGWLPGALLLGLLWGLWHLPVVDSLGAASPHGLVWPAFLAAFVAIIAAIRVLIAWAYVHTESLLLAQLIHASSTASLVVLGAPGVTPSEEALWYSVYAVLLWALMVIVVGRVSAGRANPSRPAASIAAEGT